MIKKCIIKKSEGNYTFKDKTIILPFIWKVA